ncbi:CPBP family intramembrane metalloprotease [Flaviaesturariibacter flavus]|uniref:CPBP family intramembrane metalloprotease n=1 Tax=Flaviaesturariibacter flavus TaxID=2502780 RepID=A0A4R1BNK3_9BACT|nr:CPBP family intramembrane glutamic endopeptidase [Flaviaesturariibacter flavus]TCJ18978.1 CPBP family intramembrane metalloprotease [Flaviaesturariibacter flavus]
MKAILNALTAYVRSLSVGTWATALLFTALLVYCNFHYGLEPLITRWVLLPRLLAWYSVFALAFWLPWLLQGAPPTRRFRVLLLLAPAIFALKLALPFPPGMATLTRGSDYWQRILYYPYKLLLTTGILIAIWRYWDADRPFYGTGAPRSSLRPYLLMLLVMLPLIAAASTQPDFLSIYPKWWHYDSVRHATAAEKLLYELSYGSDFITIELFFRGFLVLAFSRIAGTKAILPMAVFYCTIHFGKPLGECISSFFGGIVLGVVSYHTRSIRGGLMVHLGIAWLMELGGWLGHQWS